MRNKNFVLWIASFLIGVTTLTVFILVFFGVLQKIPEWTLILAFASASALVSISIFRILDTIGLVHLCYKKDAFKFKWDDEIFHMPNKFKYMPVDTTWEKIAVDFFGDNKSIINDSCLSLKVVINDALAVNAQIVAVFLPDENDTLKKKFGSAYVVLMKTARENVIITF